VNLVLLPGLNNTTAVWTPLTSQLTALGLDSGASYETIEKCGHMLPIERPTKTAAVTFRWLKAQA